MDVLLVEVPHGSVSERRAATPPLGLAYIAAVLEQRGHSVEIVDMNIDSAELERRVEEAQVVGISSYTQNYPFALAVLETAKEQGKSAVIGGVHATFRYREVLGHGFDFAVRGEGELAFAELVSRLEQGRDVRGVRGIAYLSNGRAKSNGVWRVRDLDALPLPARHLLDLRRYDLPGAIATSRGCAYSCVYCSSRAMSGKLRMRSPESVAAEVEQLRSLGLRSFFVIDPNFAYSRERALRICSLVSKLGMQWYAELRLDHVDEELIKALAEAGCQVVRFGIESGSQEVVNAIKKGIAIKNLLDVVRRFVREGITPVCGFMIGHPWDTKESVEATVRLAEEVRSLGGEATFAVQTPYPDTYLFRHASELGMRLHSCNWWEFHHLNPVVETRHFSVEELRTLLFDALARLYKVEVPNVAPAGDAPAMLRVLPGVERRSFRSIAIEKEATG